MQTVLITGFGPFERHVENPSGAIARALDGAVIAGAAIAGRRVEVSWRRAFGAIEGAARELAPAMLISLGLAAEATAPRLEVLAKNAGSPRADVDGFTPELGPLLELVPGAPAAYFTTLPVAAITRCARSSDAGAYLCNFVFYRAMHELSPLVPRIGFLHVPPAVELEQVRAVIEEAVRGAAL